MGLRDGNSRTFKGNSRMSRGSSRKFNASSNSKTYDGNNRRHRSHRPRQRNGRMCPQDDNSPKWHGRPRNSPGPQQANSSSARREGTRIALQTRMTRNRTGDFTSYVSKKPAT
jgi:hypothetical protein